MERGARLVASIDGQAKVVIQLPRGLQVGGRVCAGVCVCVCVCVFSRWVGRLVGGLVGLQQDLDLLSMVFVMDAPVTIILRSYCNNYYCYRHDFPCGRQSRGIRATATHPHQS